MDADKWITSFDAASTEELTPSFDFPADLDTYSEDRFRDLNLLTPDDVFYTYDQEISYRAMDISIMQQSSVRITSSPEYNVKETSLHYLSVSKPTLSKNSRDEIKIVPLASSSSFASSWGSVFDSYLTANAVKATTESTQPCLLEKPLYLVNTNFVCEMTLSDIQERINHVLNAVNEVSFEFDPAIYKWSASYVRGSKFTKLDIQIYSNEPRPGYIVEALRIKGDGKPFFQIYNDIKNVLRPQLDSAVDESSVLISRPSVSFNAGSFVPTSIVEKDSSDFLNQSDAKEALSTLVDMVNCDSIESKLEIAKIICDITQRDDSLEYLRELDIINVLAVLSSSKHCECTRRNAVLALTKLSESPSFQESIVDSGVLQTLLENCIDGPYSNCETRRASARIIANISSRLAPRITEKLGLPALQRWLDSIDNIHDSKLRVHADRARMSFNESILAA